MKRSLLHDGEDEIDSRFTPKKKFDNDNDVEDHVDSIVSASIIVVNADFKPDSVNMHSRMMPHHPSLIDQWTKTLS
ncbi:hypothetical protein MP228_009903 [Amoeboaphelidium protococcarum]|nr:hypothetical protein MP228_009903 [Amoeboaphelidium protococcarum]